MIHVRMSSYHKMNKIAFSSVSADLIAWCKVELQLLYHLKCNNPTVRTISSTAQWTVVYPQNVHSQQSVTVAQQNFLLGSVKRRLCFQGRKKIDKSREPRPKT